MKKTLIALAAVAVTGAAFAQSSVTISGRIDISGMNNAKTSIQDTRTAPTDTTKTSATGANNAWTTSELVFSGSEDLGGGLKAGFTIASSFGAATSTIGSRDLFMSLSGGFGTVRLGKFVPAAALGYFGYTGSNSTNQAGNLYGIAHSTSTDASGSLSGANFASGVAAGALTAGTFERNSNQIQYTSPSFNGLTVNVNYGTSKSDSSILDGKANTQQTGVSVNYSAGALSIGAGTNDRKVDTEAGANNVAALKIKGDLDWIGASYNFGVATVAASHINRKDKTDGVTAQDIAVNAIGVTVPMGAYTLAASTYSGKNKRATGATDDYKLSGHQLSVRYSLSKRTTVYAAMGEAKTKRDGTNNEITQKRTSNTVGLLHTF